MLHTRLSFFADPQFQTHDPTQPTEKIRTHYQSNQTQPDPAQPNRRVNPTHGQLWAIQL